jgi:hypothetical protein
MLKEEFRKINEELIAVLQLKVWRKYIEGD